MVDATLFIGAVIAGMTQLLKTTFPKISGSWTIVTAVLVGVLVAVIDKEVGVTDVTIAQGVMIAFGTAGVVGTAQMVGRSYSTTPEVKK